MKKKYIVNVYILLLFAYLKRSPCRTGNGGNGTTAPKEATPSSGNGSYSNSSPLPVNTSADRSNNSSPQQTRHHSPTPETTGSDASKSSSSESTSMGAATKSSATVEKTEKNADTPGKNQKDSNMEVSDNSSSNTPSNAASNASTSAPPVELHPRKRKMKPSKEAQQAAATAAANEAAEATSAGPEVHPHDQPITNCYQLFLNIRKQVRYLTNRILLRLESFVISVLLIIILSGLYQRQIDICRSREGGRVCSQFSQNLLKVSRIT